MFKGSIVALITPMLDDGSIDTTTFYDLIEWHIASKSNGLVIAGTTGESATLDGEEQRHLLELTVKQVAGRIPVIAGTGSNSTRTTLHLTQQAKEVGADACLIVTPYYNKPTQSGLYEHYRLVASTVDIPIILYNVPSRTACDLLPETIARLAMIPNIIGIKEATGKLERAKDIAHETPKAFTIYSGDDATSLALMEQGAQGVISVTANIAPLEMHHMCAAALSGNLAVAEEINTKLALLHQRLFVESNPIPVKWALHAMGKIPAGIRLPLLTLDNTHHLAVKEALLKAGVHFT